MGGQPRESEREMSYDVPFVVVDIDGTVADCSQRRHHLLKQPKDWDAFFAGIPSDLPIESSCRLVRVLGSWGFYRVIFCTGRGEEYREQTEAWLRETFEGMAPRSWFSDSLLMRATADRRDDPVVKPELLASRGITPQNTAFILEDRNRMVARWRELGFTCFQVADGDF